MVGTNDVHFLNKEDHFAHDCLCCISMGRLVAEENRMTYPTELYLKSDREMATALASFDGAMENTLRIAGMCDVELDFSKRFAPVYKVPEEFRKTQRGMGVPPMIRPKGVSPLPDLEQAAEQGQDAPGTDHGRDAHATNEDEAYLRELCERGLDWRYGTREVSDEIRQRLEKEIGVIAGKGFCSYFLIVWDFCNYARERGIPVGARGSGVGTMVGYLLGLCNVDPLKFGLLFERFMDPSRNDMPDIDIDICQNGRGEVIDYVRNKYGHVAQIITFGTLAAKAACKDVGRVMGVPLAEIDKLTKLIPSAPPGITLDQAIARVPELKQLVGTDPQIGRVMEIAKKLEGLCRNAGCHAAGVVIADRPLDEFVPLYQDKEGNVLTQYEGPTVEKCGLLKMDFLGLRTLSTLQRSIDLVEQTQGIKLDIEKITYDDPKVLALFCRGETRGIFQFESGGMQDLLMKMQPDRLEDLIAANALYRPGPMELIPSYCNRKHGREEVPRVHPIMDGLLAETYGIMCIHEDARVSMADGTERPIKHVRAGDRVHSLNHETHAFEIRECHGCGPTRRGGGVRVTLENGFSVTLTDDHKVLTYDGMKEAGTLDPATDLVAVGRHLRQDRPTAGRLAPWLGEDEDVAYLLGCLVGDGALSGKGITIATGREENHQKIVQFLNARLPKLKTHAYFAVRSWYLDVSCGELLNEAGYGNRKTKLHHLLEQLDMKVSVWHKRVPEVIFRCDAKARAAFLAGLLDADGCVTATAKGAGVCFFSSASDELLQGVRRLCQLEGVPATLRRRRIQFWDLKGLERLLSPYLQVRRFVGRRTAGATVGWIPRPALLAAVPAGESERHFSARTGILRQGMHHDYPFVKSSTAAKAGIELGDTRFFRIAKIETVEDQQFYGMSVADHHNLVADGIVVKNCYQEQVMQVFNQLGGIELADAYKLIKAISKKKSDVIEKFKPKFLSGAKVNGLNGENAKDIFALILKFGAYGFNKSHSTRYAMVAYQTAYMKTYHPVEYMAALLTFEMGNTDKVVEYIDECRRLTLPDGSRGIKVLPPDVNVSKKDFTPVYQKPEKRGGKREGTIRFGLCAVRGVGEKAVEAILEQREAKGDFASLFEFFERVDSRSVQRATAEALIKCGAFFGMSAARAPMLHALDRAFEMGQQAQSDARAGQLAMFGQPAAGSAAMAESLPKVDEFPQQELLKFEKELLGFYITSHPLTEHQSAVDRYTTATTKEAMEFSEGAEVVIGGMLSAVRPKVAKSGRSAGQKWAILEIEDLDGRIEGMCFSECFADVETRHPEALKKESIVFIRGKVDKRRETPCLMVNDVIPVADSVGKLTTAVVVKLDPLRHPPETVAEVKAMLATHRGNCEVYAQLPGDNCHKVTLRLGRGFAVRPSADLVDDLDRFLGTGSTMLVGEGTKRMKRREKQAQQRLFAGDTAPEEGIADEIEMEAPETD